jgi:hypothetical protein
MYSALPGIDAEGGTKTATLPGICAVGGTTVFVPFDKEYPVLPDTIVFVGDTCAA